MEPIDFKLKLFGGRPIKAEGYGDIAPLTVGKIIDIGYSEYLKCLNILTLSANDFLDDPPPEIHVLELVLLFGGDEIENVFLDSLSLFLDGEAIVDKDEVCVYIKRSETNILVVNRDNYFAIQDVIKWQNYINSFDEKNLKSFDPADEETRKLREKLDALNKKTEDLKRKQKANEGDDPESDIDFYDILSSIASKAYGVNELNVNDLTIFQVYRKFKRMEIIDQYDISIQSILAGAKNVKLKHWSSKD